MIKRFYLPVALAFLTCSISRAGITDLTGSGSSGVSSPIYTLSSDGTSVDINTTQWGVGQINADITTDGDPTLSVNNTINNDTSFAWAAYGVNIFMSQSFSIANPFVYNPGWSVQSLVQPTWNGSQYEGQISYVGGVPVDIGQILSFSYQITFGGSATFGQTLNPSPVPEPASLSLLAGGLLLLAGGRRLAKRG